MAVSMEERRPEPASRTLTFLFTDIEGSTRLWEHHQQAMKDALERHDAILRGAVEGSRGEVVKTIGDGFMAVFDSAVDGICASLDAQRKLMNEEWGETGPLRVRMGLHAGEAATREGDYFGPTLNRTARIMSAGHGGQVLLSAAAAALVIDRLPEGARLEDLGEHQLKGLGRGERVFQLSYPGAPASFPPLVTPTRRRSHLPEQPSAFVGRVAELKEISARLADESVRLLTLTGPGGIGKTRLSLCAAAGAVDQFEDGVFFVDLAAARDGEALLAAIAGAIGFGDTRSDSLIDELTERLRDESVLLVLDNFEQVTVAAPTVAELLHECAKLKVLVTSREALHLRGEHQFAVPPLSLPSAARGHASAAQLAQYEAIQFFVERARSVRPDFELTDANAAAVAEICLRLDGLPLALELATARINLFSPEALRDRLDSSLQLLRSGARDMPERQQTLRATIEWSYELLEPGEQRLFELLAAFSGATFEAVEVVAGSVNGRSGTQIDTLDGLASLVDKSLLRQADRNGDSQLVMLETISEYATERLNDSPDFSAAARRAHALYFADFARRQWEDVKGDRRDAALAALSANTENLRRAWDHWVEESKLDHLNMLVDSLWLLYDTQGRYHAMIELATELLNVLPSTPPSRERAIQELTMRTSLARALMVFHGFTQEVEEEYARALELFEGERDLPQLFPVLRGLATLHQYSADFERSAELGREILHLAEAQDDASMRVDGHLVVGSSLGFMDDLEGGLEHLDRGIDYFESQGQGSRQFQVGANPGVASYTTSALLLWLRGFPDRAVDRANRAVTVATELRHPFTMAYALFHTGFLHLWRREPEPMRDRAVGVLDVADEYDQQIWTALGSVLLGGAKTALDRADEGLAEIREGVALYQGLQTPPVFWPLLCYVRAGACLRAGKAAEGLDYIEEAIEINGEEGPLPTVFYAQKGDLLLALPKPDRAGAQASYQQAFDAAEALGARTPQLRAAMGLYRTGREGAIDLLRTTHETFTEGFETPDLIEAKELLGG